MLLELVYVLVELFILELSIIFGYLKARVRFKA